LNDLNSDEAPETDDILVITATPVPTDTPAPIGTPVTRTSPAPDFRVDRLFGLAEYLKWQYGLEDDAKLCKHAAIEIKGLRQALREAAQGVKALEEEILRLRAECDRLESANKVLLQDWLDYSSRLLKEISRMGEMWRAAEFDGEPA
jgi:hypothetical protein